MGRRHARTTIAWLAVLALVGSSTAHSQTINEHLHIAGQVNVIAQAHPAFPAMYSGANSLRRTSEHAVSQVLTLYTGVTLPRGWEVVFDAESAGGRGLSDALGLAGFTNLDVVRNPTLGSTPYVARALVRKVFAFSSATTTVATSPVSLTSRVPARRFEVRAGKLSLVDVFDLNAVGSDSHLQFTNWTIDNNGAYDYAADTRGYTFGVIAEYDAPRWSIRGAEALMPTVANGITLDWNLTRARGENVEFEWRGIPHTTLRVLSFLNHANMGSYSAAVTSFEQGHTPTPDVVAQRRQGREKSGVGMNVEYLSPSGVRLFARSGWNSGDSESFAYTEVNNTVSGGADVEGSRWHRSDDRVGAAIVSNGLSTAHAAYLRLGGLGFLLGDGALTYGRETIVESYYTARVWHRFYASIGGSYIWNPGYNRHRGPVFVQMARVHLDL